MYGGYVKRLVCVSSKSKQKGKTAIKIENSSLQILVQIGIFFIGGVCIAGMNFNE